MKVAEKKDLEAFVGQDVGSVTSSTQESSTNRKKLLWLGGFLGLVGLIAVVAGALLSGDEETEPLNAGLSDEEKLALFMETGQTCLEIVNFDAAIGSYDQVYQGIDSLKTAELSGTEDVWSQYLEAVIDPATSGFVGVLTFKVDDWIPLEMVSSFTVDINFRGMIGALELWDAEVRHVANKKWDPLWVWTNQGVENWAWTRKSQQTNLNGGLQDYVTEDGMVMMRLVTRDSVENGLFDYVGFCLTIEANTPQPTAPPVQPPTTGEEEIPCFQPFSHRSIHGRIGDVQNVENMQTLQLSGVEDIWDYYVEFIPDSESLHVDLLFNSSDVNLVEMSNMLNAIRLDFNYRGPQISYQPWYFDLYDNVKGQWERIGDNRNAPDWAWYEDSITTILQNPISNYVSNMNRFKVRVYSPTWIDACLVDYLLVCFEQVETKTPTDAPTPEPTLPPTTGVPTMQPTSNCPRPSDEWPEWTYQSLICGLALSTTESDEYLAQLANTFYEQGCTTVMLDSRLSYWLNWEEFQQDVNVINKFSIEAHKLGMKTSIYYPTTEIMTDNGQYINETAGKLHPDWVQVGLNGKLNLFYGNLEHWVSEGQESAWMDPENPAYTEYFLERVRELGKTAVDSFWGDVPIYHDTGTAWAGASGNASVAFAEYSLARGYCGTQVGCSLPGNPQGYLGEQDEFLYWVEWRHHSIANFLERIKIAFKEAGGDEKVVFAENFPTDYMDASLSGLDASYYFNRNGLSNVWEIDSVSNVNGMKYSDFEDFANQLTMRKYARGVDRKAPTWAFAYGSSAGDAGLVVAGALAVGTAPLETKTPAIASTSSGSMRTQYFNWAKGHLCELLQTPRYANVGILYSSRTRDFSDLLRTGGGYGMYNDFTPNPSYDDDWWGTSKWSTPLVIPHLGDYRGASYAAQMLHLQYKIFVDVQATSEDFDGLNMVWLASTTCLSDTMVELLKTFVYNGGVVLATNEIPGAYDAFCKMRDGENPLSMVFGEMTPGGQSQRSYGAGFGIYRGDITSKQFFIHESNEGYGSSQQTANLNKLASIVDTYVPTIIQITNNVKNIFVEISENRDVIYLVNYNGLQQPYATTTKTLNIAFRPLPKLIKSLTVTSPNGNGATNDMLPFTFNENTGMIEFSIVIDQLSLLLIEYE